MSANSEQIEQTRQLLLSRISLDNVDPRDVTLVQDDQWFVERFVLDRQLDGDKDVVSSAAKALEKCLHWRFNECINDLTDRDFPLELHQKSGLLIDASSKVLYVQVAKYRKFAEWSKVSANFLFYNTDKFYRLLGRGQGTVIIDFQGAGLANADIAQAFVILDLATNYYPRMCGKVITVDVNFIVRPVVKFMSSLLPHKFSSMLVHGTRSDLLELLGDDTPTFLGGEKMVKRNYLIDGSVKSVVEFGHLNNISDSGVKKFKKYLDELVVE